MVLRRVVLIVLLCSLGCATRGVNIERHAFALAEKNRAGINKVRIGQTLVEVERLMGPPEVEEIQSTSWDKRVRDTLP